MTVKKIRMMVGALIIGTLHLNAGNTDFGMEYTTEMQTDFRKKGKYFGNNG